MSDNSAYSSPELPTQDLLAQASGGSAEAWSVLYERYRVQLLLSVREKLDQRNDANFEDEDVLQSAFLSAWAHIDGFQYRGEGSFRRWLKRIVVNNAVGKLRKLAAERRNIPSARHDVDLIRDGSSRRPSELVSSAENEARLMECLDALPGDLREVLVLRDFEQRTWTEIARITASADSTARDRYRNAWTRLSRVMHALDHSKG